MKPLSLLERLRVAQPDARWTAAGSRVSGRCPYHEDKTPSFHIYLDRGYAKCYGCNHYVSNPVEFWGHVRSLGRAEALADLRQLFGLKFLTTSSSSQLRDWERNQVLKKKIAQICHDELINAISAPDDPKYAFAQEAVTYLLNVRRLPRDTIPTLGMVGVVPPLATIIRALDKEAETENLRRLEIAAATDTRVEKVISYSAEAQEYLKKSAGWLGSLIFRLDVTPDIVGRLKIRRADSKDFLILEDAYEDDLGFLGLGWSLFRGLLGPQQHYVPGAYVVEGEFDALSIMARQVEMGGPGFVVLSAGGSPGGHQIDNLRNVGFEEGYLVGDGPSKNGDELIKSWLPHIRKLRTRIFVGYSAFPGCGDPDEAVVRHGLDVVQRTFLDLTNKNLFQHPQDWIFERAAPEIEAIDESDLRFRTESAAEWGRYLKNGVECDVYVEYCAKAYGLPAALLKREIVAREEDEPAFIFRVANVLSQQFFVVGQRSSEATRRLVLWHKQQRKIVEISLSDDGSIERELGAVQGPHFQFFQEHVGLPPFLETPDIQKAKGTYLKKQHEDFRFYLRQALTHLSQGAPDFDTAPRLGQGIHVVRSPDGGPPTLYAVNGRDVYVGTFDAHEKLNWIALEGPSYNGLIFDVGIRQAEPAWMDGVNSVSDLDRAPTIDLKDVWARLHALIDNGWRYKNHAVTAKFLTSHLIAATLCNAFRRQVMVAFHADSRAGKSKMLMGLIGGTAHPEAKVVAAAVGMPDFTAAGIRQRMNNKVLPLCLDEFEDEGSADRKGRTITETLEMFRNLTGEDNTFSMGSREGTPVTWRLNFFVFIAAINKARKVQDANRMVAIYMERSDNRPDPIQILKSEYGVNYLTQLRQDMVIALLPHAAELQRAYGVIEAHYGKAGSIPSGVDSRVFEALYPALSILKLMGEDYQAYADEFCEANAEMLAVTAGHTDSMALFNWICQSPKLKVRVGEHGDRNDATLLQMLAMPETRDDINSSGSGLYYDDLTETLVVNWTTAIQTVLSSNSRYSRETNVYNLRDLANRAPHALKPDELENSDALRRLRGHGLMGVPVSHMSGFSITHLMHNLKPTHSVESPAPLKEEPAFQRLEVDDGDFGT